MAVTLLGQVALLVGSEIFKRLLKPHTKRTPAPDLEFPRADEGAPIPIVYGLQAVSPIITAVGDVKKDDGDDNVVLYESLTTGHLCLGPIDEIVDIQFGGKSLRLHPMTRKDSISATDKLYPVVVEGSPSLPGLPYVFGDSPVTFDVNARMLFGGEKSEGGVERHIRVHPGVLTGSVDAVTTHLWQQADLPGDGTAYPGVAYVVFGDIGGGGEFYWGTVPQPKSPVFLVKLIPNALGLGAIGNDANPAEILYDLLTHPLRGAGIDPALIDADSFSAAGAILRDEGLGLSCTFAEQQELMDMLEDVLKHVDGQLLIPHPATGLITFSLARPVEDVDALPHVTRSTAADLEVTRPSWRETTNEVKVVYRKYEASGFTDQAVVDEPLTPSSGLAFKLGGFGVYQCNGRFLTNVTLRNVTRSLDVDPSDYSLNPDSGVFVFQGIDDVLETGDDLTVSYTNGSEFVGYREATAQAQDLANQFATGEVRSETFEYPFFTNEITAGVHAARLLKQLSRPLAKATWTEDRTAHATVPVDVRAIDWAPFGMTAVPFRIGKVTDDPDTGRLRFDAVEDVFGASVFPAPAPSSNNSAPGERVAPSMGIGCGIGGTNVRVAFFPSDANFSIKLWVADDDADTNRAVVDTYPGTTAYYDTATTGKFYQTQLVRTGWTDGPLTPYITCTVSGGSPEAPTCTLPTWQLIPDLVLGNLLAVITDPQSRVQSVEFRAKSGPLPWSDWAVDTSDPYQASVPLDASQDSYIETRITYYDCSGNEQVEVRSTVFPLDATAPTPPPVDPGSDGKGPLCVDVVFHASGSDTDEVLVSADPAELADKLRVVFDTTGFTQMRLQYQYDEDDDPGPAGSFLFVECRPRDSVDLADFQTPGLVAGPVIALDQTAGPVRWSDWVDLRGEALGDVEFRRLTRDGDDTTYIKNRHLRMQFRRGVPGDTGSPGTPTDPPADGLLVELLGGTGKTIDTVSSGGGGGAGVAYSDPWNYASALLALAGGWTITFTANDQTITYNDAHVVGGGNTHGLKIALNGGAFSASGTWRATKQFAMTPGTLASARMWVDTLNNGSFENLVLTVRDVNSGVTWNVSTHGVTQTQVTTSSVMVTGPGMVEVTIEKDAGFPYNHPNECYWFAGLEVLGTPAVSPFDIVTQWDDQSGHGNNAVWQDTDPYVLDGDGLVILQDGGRLQLPSGILDGFPVVEIYAAVEAAADPNSGDNILWELGAQASRYPNGSGHILEGAGRATAQDAGNPTPTLTALNLYHVRVSAAGVSILLNTTPLAQFGPDAIQWAADLFLGGGVTLAELRIYGLQGFHTDPQRDGIYQGMYTRNPDLGDPDTPLPEPPPAPTDPLPPITGSAVLAHSVALNHVLIVPPSNGVYASRPFYPRASIPANLTYAIDNNIGILGSLLVNEEMQPSGNGSFSLARALGNIDTYAAYKVQMKAAYDAGALRGFIHGDDINQAGRWGRALTSQELEAMAQRIKQALGFDIPCYLRCDPINLEKRQFRFVYTNGCIAQYDGPLHHQRWPVGTYIANMRAAAARLGLRLILGHNLVNGGDGSSGIRGSGVSDSPEVFWFLSATDIRRDAGAMAQAIKSGQVEKILVDWCRDWPTVDDKPYLLRADIQAAWQYVKGIMDS